MKPVQTGIERLLADPPSILEGKRLGLLANPASVACPEGNQRFRPTRVLIANHYPDQLKAFFSPQHGFFAEKQADMVPSKGLVDPLLGIPVFSLYGETRVPTQTMLDLIDVLIIDLQDVGTRVYTFISTMALCLQAARTHDKQVLVLDRPNPIGGNRIEGNCLKPEHTSFVGMYPIPMRHGDTGLPWIPPSPNLPTPTSALVYPGQVLWEGTNVSEGRGTTQPFEIFGAPFFDTTRLEASIPKDRLAGVHLRLKPTSHTERP